MHRTTIVAPDELPERLRRIAAERHTSMAEVIGEALATYADQYRPRPRSLGLGASGHHDTAQRASDERPIPRQWR